MESIAHKLRHALQQRGEYVVRANADTGFFAVFPPKLSNLVERAKRDGREGPNLVVYGTRSKNTRDHYVVPYSLIRDLLVEDTLSVTKASGVLRWNLALKDGKLHVTHRGGYVDVSSYHGAQLIIEGEENHESVNMTEALKAEKDRRLNLWARLKDPGEHRGVEPSVLRNLGVYGGAQVIWVDAARTASASGNGKGITVSLLHTGSSYADDLSEDGLIYHYPQTNRPPARDLSEIEATKAARSLGLPVFVISYPSPNSSLRRVRLGWVEDWDDQSKMFRVTFGKEPSRPPAEEQQEPFSLFGDEVDSKRMTRTRIGQQKFKFSVIKRYGVACAACGISIPELLDASHIAEKGKRGTDDPRNGLVFCATHHRAFDSLLFAIDPETTVFEFVPGGPSASDLNFRFDSLDHLPNKPHPLALRARWDAWTSKHAKGLDGANR